MEIERRDYLVSLPADGVRFSDAVRQHWGVEVSFAEDASRIRKDKGAQTFSGLRHIALNLLRRDPNALALAKKPGQAHQQVLFSQ